MPALPQTKIRYVKQRRHDKRPIVIKTALGDIVIPPVGQDKKRRRIQRVLVHPRDVHRTTDPLVRTRGGSEVRLTELKTTAGVAQKRHHDHVLKKKRAAVAKARRALNKKRREEEERRRLRSLAARKAARARKAKSTTNTERKEMPNQHTEGKKPMTEAQKAALAKGRIAANAKRAEDARLRREAATNAQPAN